MVASPVVVVYCDVSDSVKVWGCCCCGCCCCACHPRPGTNSLTFTTASALRSDDDDDDGPTTTGVVKPCPGFHSAAFVDRRPNELFNSSIFVRAAANNIVGAYLCESRRIHVYIYIYRFVTLEEKKTHRDVCGNLGRTFWIFMVSCLSMMRCGVRSARGFRDTMRADRASHTKVGYPGIDMGE